MAVLVLGGLCTTTANALQVHEASAESDGGGYRVSVDALVDASLADVRSLLTDYENLGRINPDISLSEILLRRAPGDLRLRTITDVCVWFYCKRIRQVQDVTEGEDGSVNAVVIPQQSDFRHGQARLRLWQETAGTRVLIHGELTPDFWVPPLIGPWLIRRKLVEEALVTLEHLERVEPLSALPHNSTSSVMP